MRCKSWMLAAWGVALGACGEPPNEAGLANASSATIPDPEAIGKCALDPSAGSLIGEIVGIGADPASGEPAYRVRLESGTQGKTRSVSPGVRVVDCAEARANERRSNPRPAPVNDSAARSSPSF